MRPILKGSGTQMRREGNQRRNRRSLWEGLSTQDAHGESHASWYLAGTGGGNNWFWPIVTQSDVCFLLLHPTRCCVSCPRPSHFEDSHIPLESVPFGLFPCLHFVFCSLAVVLCTHSGAEHAHTSGTLADSQTAKGCSHSLLI